MNTQSDITYENLASELNETQAADLASHLKEVQQQIDAWIKADPNCKIICVTSGGTSVPIEKKTVRMLENFSAGNRGAISTE
jgi:DNA / pantothenate metabolism flavoprotein.